MAVPKMIEQHMEVVGCHGAHVGIVDKIEGTDESSWRRTTRTQAERNTTFRLLGWSIRRSKSTSSCPAMRRGPGGPPTECSLIAHFGRRSSDALL
jgi:hypothetical protein